MDFGKILRKISPSQAEKRMLNATAKEVVSKLKKYIPAEPMLMGSIAKGTSLKGEADVDLFFLFSKKYTKEEMGRIVITACKKVFRNVLVHYAEHPYARFYYKKIKFDIVPAYKLESVSEMGTSVDRTQFHLKYIKKHLRKSQIKEVLLLKQFLKANDLYGAEIKTQGFSGYLCELLIIEHGSFLNLLKAASKWKPKFPEPLVVPDPVDEKRNVASPLSRENFDRFVALAKEFLKNPSEEFFFPKIKKLSKKQLAEKFSNIVGLVFPSPKVVDDIKWGQIRKLKNQLEHFLSHKGFFIENIFLYDDGKISAFIVHYFPDRLPPYAVQRGPPITDEKNVQAFKKKHRKTFVKGERVYALEKQPQEIEHHLRVFLKSTLPSKYEKNKKKIRIYKKEKVFSKFAEMLSRQILKKNIFKPL
ncbi:MAG: CCA tRNA nucleotidyltransferase [Candidatus Anstonellales archaeon]